MLPVSRALIDRDRELDTMAGVHANPAGAPGTVRGMKRGDPEPDGQTAATLVDSTGAECKRPRIDGSGGIGEVGQAEVLAGRQKAISLLLKEPVMEVKWPVRSCLGKLNGLLQIVIPSSEC
ncbi:hypothetical protein GOODEAATRI_014201 [Goodea atripinnis]|uniref:Uncharacterized protein n=1 Tax=Goodea atripinnis TaxID=208336 RepID=A0ABV0MRZ5_9TELE